MLKHSKRILALVGATAAVALVWAGLTLAKGPKPPPPPPLPPPGQSSGTIFYCETDDSGVTWISRMNWDGTGRARLYSDDFWVVTGWDVSHSDTATSHRFLIYEEPYGHALYVVDLWDPNLTRRTIYGNDSFSATSVRVSQDDTKVAFLGYTGNQYDHYVYVADLVKDENGVPTGIDDSTRVQVAYVSQRPNSLTWSPEGERIAFGIIGSWDQWQDGEIYVLSLSTKEINNITNTPGVEEYYPDWSPALDEYGASRIAFHAWDLPRPRTNPASIYTVRPDGTNRKLAVSKANSGSDANGLPSWSPDGQQIAFSAVVTQKGGDLVMRSAADGSTSAVTLTPVGDHWGAIKWRPGP